MREEDYQSALLMVRTALGLHRDSQDDLVVVAQKLRAENESLKALAKLGRWFLEEARVFTQFSPGIANAIEDKAVELGLGTMEDMGTYFVFVETDKAKALDVDP